MNQHDYTGYIHSTSEQVQSGSEQVQFGSERAQFASGQAQSSSGQSRSRSEQAQSTSSVMAIQMLLNKNEVKVQNKSIGKEGQKRRADKGLESIRILNEIIEDIKKSYDEYATKKTSGEEYA